MSVQGANQGNVPQPEAKPAVTQQALPNTEGKANAPADTGHELKAANERALKAEQTAANAAKEIEALKKAHADPKFLDKMLAERLGLGKEADPAKELETLKSKVATGEQDAAKWRTNAKRNAINAAVVSAASGFHDPNDALAISVADLDIDDTGALSAAAQATIRERVGALGVAKPYLMAGAAPAGGPPLPTPGKPAPTPPPNGKQPADEPKTYSPRELLKMPLVDARKIRNAAAGRLSNGTSGTPAFAKP